MIRKKISFFHKAKNNKDGLRGICGQCFLSKYRGTKEQQQRHRENSRLSSKKINFRKNNPIAMRIHDKAYRDRNKNKTRARNLANYAIRSGKIKKQNCCKCKSTITQAHHEDYTKPFDIVWYCLKHHSERHVQINELKRKKPRACISANPRLMNKPV